MRHARALDPFTSTVHAPHTPCSQPTWVPVRPSSWRRKSLSNRRGSTARWYARPLTVTATRYRSGIATHLIERPPNVERGRIVAHRAFVGDADCAFGEDTGEVG